ncbi:MAG: hypothetical protein AAGK01_01720 [Pseudomonadota bacterium]
MFKVVAAKFLVTCFVAGAVCAQAAPPAGWQSVDNNDVGDVFRGPGEQTVRVASRAEIESECNCTLTEGWSEATILQGLSVMWIDVADHSVSGVGASLSLVGEAMTETGDVSIVARGVGDRLNVLLTSATMAAAKAEQLVAADWSNGSGRARVASAATQPQPKQRQRTPANTSVPPGRYTIPSSLAQAGKDWTKVGQWWAVQKPQDARSPRFASGQTGPKYGVRDHRGAVGAISKYFGVKFVGKPTLAPIAEWKKLDGSDFRIAFADTNLGGTEGVAFMLIKQPRGALTFQINVLEMPKSTFVEWGGAARMMVLRGLMPNMGVFPKERLQTIANAPMNQQAGFYQAAARKYYEIQSARTMAMSQTNLLLGMQELNYDLLFGNDIGTSVVDY